MLNSKEMIVEKTNTEMIHAGARDRKYTRAASLLLAAMVAFGAAGCGKTAKEQGTIETEKSVQASAGSVQAVSGSKTKKGALADTAADKNKTVSSKSSATSGEDRKPVGKNRSFDSEKNSGSKSASSDNRKTVNDNSRTTVENNYYTDNYYVENNHAENNYSENNYAEVQVLQENITQVQQVAENTEVINYDVDVTDIDEDYNPDVTEAEAEYYIDVNADSDANTVAGENEDDTEETDTEAYIAQEEEAEPVEAEDPYAGVIDISTEDMLAVLTDGYWLGGMHQAQVLEFDTDGRIYEVGVGVNQNDKWTFLEQDSSEYGTYDVDHGILTVYLDGEKAVTLKYVDSVSGYEALETEDARSSWSQAAEEMGAFEDRLFYETAYVYDGSGEDVRCMGHLGQVHFEDGETEDASGEEELVDEESYEYEDEAAYYGDANDGYEEYGDTNYEGLSDEDSYYEDTHYEDTYYEDTFYENASEGAEFYEEYEEGSEW